MLKTNVKECSAPKPLLQALRGIKSVPVPFWFMRQAGRYLPEYMELRQKAGSFLNLCFNPQMAAEVTLQPLRRFDMDAAILFSDILVIPLSLGQELDFVEGEGPQLGTLDIESLSFNPEKLLPVYDTLKLVRKELASEKTLIGFAGAPWTVACYMVEGRGTGHFNKTKDFARTHPETFDTLVDIVTDATVSYLVEQVKSGADTVQLFDSWAGLLEEPYYTRWVITPAIKIRARLKKEYPDIPVIGFPRGAGKMYKDYAEKTGMDGIGIDTQTPIEWAMHELPSSCCLQGNLDPELLLAGGQEMKSAALKILKAAKDRPFIFNLGHGIIKETPPQNVADMCKIIREFRG